MDYTGTRHLGAIDSAWVGHCSTDKLRQLLASLEAMEQTPPLTIAGVKAALEHRRDPAAPA
jgi:hypothetical protein